MYNLNLKEGVKRLSDAKLRAWLGIHFMTYTWRQPDLSRRWNSGECAGQKMPDFRKIMPFSNYKEIRANIRFEDYRRVQELKLIRWKSPYLGTTGPCATAFNALWSQNRLENIKKGRIYIQSALVGITDTCMTKWSGHLR